jgi:hypothetical protein
LRVALLARPEDIIPGDVMFGDHPLEHCDV